MDQRVLDYVMDPKPVSLSLDGQSISMLQLQALVGSVKIKPSVVDISFAHADLNDERLAILAPWFNTAPNVRSLNLEYNNITSSGLATLLRVSADKYRIATPERETQSKDIRRCMTWSTWNC